MTTRRWLAALSMVLMMLLGGSAQAGERHGRLKAPHVRTLDPSARPKIVFRGRALSYAAWASMATGAVMAPLGGGLAIYDYNGDPFEKWRYDAVWKGRKAAALPLEITGFTLMGAHFPMLMVGVLVEGHGLRRLTPVSVIPGWVGFGLVLTGALVSMPFGPANLIVGPTLAVAGYGCVLAQFGLNVRASRKYLTPEVRDELYHTRRSVSVGAAPMFLKGGGGATFVMSY